MKLLTVGSISHFFKMPCRLAPDERLRERLRGKAVVCVGTGPSLDFIDTSKLKNSVVILLNYAILRKSQFDESNDFYWMAIDSDRISAIIGLVDSSTPKIVSSHTVQGVYNVKKFVGPSDYFIPLSYDLHLGIRGFYTLPTRPLLLEELLPLNKWSNKNPHGSVMSMAIRLCLTLDARTITLIGYDATVGTNKAYANGTPLRNENPFSRGDLEPIDRFLLNECKKKGVRIINSSPLTESLVFPDAKELPIDDY